ncbi:hypothetical protein [Streptomyces cyaneofuscatus]|uniref:hypothetical protein n=1 Tax=Streptomyces cyaneofuscatus TaxID=66883 RepID=UPI00366018C0
MDSITAAATQELRSALRLPLEPSPLYIRAIPVPHPGQNLNKIRRISGARFDPQPGSEDSVIIL